MKYIFLIAAFNAFFFVLQLLPKRKKPLHDRILITWLSYLGFSTTTYAFSTDLLAENQLLFSGLIASFMLNGPFMYLYTSALIQNKERTRKIEYLHFLPFLIFISYLFLSSFYPDYAKNIRLEHVPNNGEPPFVFLLLLLLTALSGPVYIYFSILLFRKLDINIFTNLSNSKDINLGWLRILVYSFGIVWTALIIITIIHHVFNLFSMFFCTDGLFLSLSTFVILIGYFGLRQKNLVINHLEVDLELGTNVKNKYASSSLKESDRSQYLEKLKSFMNAKKPYLDENLTLTKLANELNIPVHHLSQLINEQLELNFFDFVNHYRVEEFKTKIVDPKFENFSLLGIAFECGFNSKSSFNRVFKKVTGLTPSKFKEQIAKS